MNDPTNVCCQTPSIGTCKKNMMTTSATLTVTAIGSGHIDPGSPRLTSTSMRKNSIIGTGTQPAL